MSSSSGEAQTAVTAAARVRPRPSRVRIRVASSAPNSAPTASEPMAMPSWAGLRCRSRIPYTVKMVDTAPKPTLSVADWASSARSSGLP